MNEKTTYKEILSVLLPFILVFTGSVFSNINASISSNLKILAFIYMLGYIFYYRKFNATLFYLTLLFIPFIIYGINNSFYIKAGIADAIRYMFPIIILMYGYSIRKQLPVLINFVAFFVVINFLVQIVNYINWLRGVDQWFYYTTYTGLRYANMTSNILRATGTVVFFGFFGFFNFIAIFLLQKYYTGRYKKLIIGLAVFGVIASISYKIFFVAVVVIFFYYIKRILNFIIMGFVFLIGLYYYNPAKVHSIIESVIVRIKLYIVEGNSVRSESYRVMWSNIFGGNFFGRGIGAFGGPASTAYHSPYYKEINFNWYDTKWLSLPTTDTYPPHAFVELGIIGALLYFFIILSPIIKRRLPVTIIIIYFALFFDMLFSFSLNNPEYLLFSLVFVYPIFYYHNAKKQTD